MILPSPDTFAGNFGSTVCDEFTFIGVSGSAECQLCPVPNIVSTDHSACLLNGFGCVRNTVRRPDAQLSHLRIGAEFAAG